MLTSRKPRLLQLRKSSNDSAWGMGLELGNAGPGLCRYRTSFTVDVDTFVPVSSRIFPRSFAVVLGLICTFCTKLH